jgi:hypothetical protein
VDVTFTMAEPVERTRVEELAAKLVLGGTMACPAKAFLP